MQKEKKNGFGHIMGCLKCLVKGMNKNGLMNPKFGMQK